MAIVGPARRRGRRCLGEGSESVTASHARRPRRLSPTVTRSPGADSESLARAESARRTHLESDPCHYSIYHAYRCIYMF